MKIPLKQSLFNTNFLSSLLFSSKNIAFHDKEISEMDAELAQYENLTLDPEVERNLLSKNELLASFAISKAENSALTLKEAEDVYKLVVNHPELDFIGEKLKQSKELTRHDYEKLEFFNIAKTFRRLNQKPFSLDSLTPKTIRQIHADLTQGMDVFSKGLSGFTVYRSGQWRDNNEIVVGSYKPPSYENIPESVEELIAFVKNDLTVTNVAIFHTALYALHAFNNGNKRVCRILEHLLLRACGLNEKNLYSTSYYYHKEKKRYYKYLLYSLERKNLNHFTSFVQEALVLSIIDVVLTSIEVQRRAFVRRLTGEKSILAIARPLVKRKEMQYKYLFRRVKNKMSNKTFTTYLQQAVEEEILSRREIGRTVFYSLNVTLPEEELVQIWLKQVRRKVPYMPEKYSMAV